MLQKCPNTLVYKVLLSFAQWRLGAQSVTLCSRDTSSSC